MPDAPGGTPLVREASGQPLALDTAGQVVLRSATAAANTPAVSLATFVNWLRANISSIKAGRAELPPVVDPNDPRLMRTFAKIPEPAGSFIRGGSVGGFAGAGDRAPLAEAAAGASSGFPLAPPTGSMPVAGATLSSSAPTSSYTFSNVAHAPIIVNNFPDSFTPWSPEDEYQMSKWNYYANEVFRVFTTPTGTYGWPNGIFDLAGWPSSADLLRVYGMSWDSNTIGVTFWRTDGAGFIIEADIALNPAFGFTLDDEWVYDGSPAQGFRQVMVHELGHMHGLGHSFNNMSVMNYMPSVFRSVGWPFMDDAAGVRAEYPSIAVPQTNLGVYLFRSTGFQSIGDATYPSVVYTGQSLTVNDYQVENAGTTTIPAATFEWYLTTARNFISPYYYLGQRNYGTLPVFSYFTPNLMSTTFTVPAFLPPGQYYLAAFIRNDDGQYQSGFPFSNNMAFSRFRIQALIPGPTVVTSAATNVTTTSARLNGTVNPNGSTTIAFFRVEGSRRSCRGRIP